VSIPTPHIEAAAGAIAETILLPGDPLRAKFIAENYLDGAVCYNQVRNMFGYTGTYKGQRISVQGTGMGMPSMSIYVTELLRFYGVKTAIRIGSCGAIPPAVKLGDVIIALSAHTTSNMNRRYFRNIDYAATASFALVQAAVAQATERGVTHHVGPVLTSDSFYDDDLEMFTMVGNHGTLAVEMECAALYTIAAREGAGALCMATVSDHLAHHEVMSSEERQTGFANMVELALETAISVS
jgi:purine-nucleoside phosphorylase